MTDPLGQSQVLPYLEGLSKKNFEIHLISFEKPNRLESIKELINKRCAESNITWHPKIYTKKPPLISTMKDLKAMYKLAFKLHKKNNFDLVHCRSYIPAIVGMKLQKRKGVKFVFDMRGFYADERIEGKIWDVSKFVYRYVYDYFKKKELQFFKKADHVVSLTNNGKKEIVKLVNNKVGNKTTVIPCCVDTNLFDPEQVNPHRKRKLKEALGIKENDFILGYIGSIGSWYMLDEMLDFFKVQLAKNKSLKFLFVTGEPADEILSKAVEKGIPKEAILMTSTIYKYMPLHISLFDFSIFFIRPTFSKRASSPTKQGELMAMGVPVICNSGVGDTDEIVNKYHSGKVLDKLNDSSYTNTTMDKNEFDSTKIREGAIDYFGLDQGVENYYSIYKKLLEKEATLAGG